MSFGRAGQTLPLVVNLSNCGKENAVFGRREHNLPPEAAGLIQAVTRGLVSCCFSRKRPAFKTGSLSLGVGSFTQCGSCPSGLVRGLPPPPTPKSA